MKKAYFMVRPSDFLIYGGVDKEGNTTYQNSKDFEVEDSGEDFVIFEAYYEEGNNGRRYSNQVREMITNRPFELQVIKAHSKEGDSLLINSEKYGLFQKRALKISEAEVKPIRVSGLLNYFTKNEEASKQYYHELGEFFENARAYKYIYDHSIGGPSDYLVRNVRRDYKRRNK